MASTLIIITTLLSFWSNITFAQSLTAANTPAPTNPPPIICGSQTLSGSFNDATVTFEIRIPFHGDMFFYLTAYGFTVSSIRAYNKLNPNLPLFQSPASSGISHVAILSLPANTDIIIETDGIGTGSFNALSHCVSLAPSPIITTAQPTNRPITPSPTHPGEIQCNQPVSGEFNGQHMMFNVIIPFQGTIKFNIQLADITSIMAFYTNDPSMILAETLGANINDLTVSDLSAFADITFLIEGNGGKSIFYAMAECVSPIAATPTPAITCGDPTIWKEAANEPLYVEVIMPYDGRLVFDASSSFGFDISGINVYDTNDLSMVIYQSSVAEPSKLIIPFLSANTKLLFKIDGTGNGLAVLGTSCTTNAPTSVPTAAPIDAALLIPVITCPGILVRDPVTDICGCPTKTPDGLWLPVCTSPFIQNPTTCDCQLPLTTARPTIPTYYPTMTPSVSPTAPTTARPTHMNHILCGDPPISGMLSDPQQIYFDVRVPFEGDITLRVTSSFRAAIIGITAYDHGDPTLPIIGRSETGELTITNLPRNTDITFRVHGNGNGLYIATTSCRTSAPTAYPTVSPVSPWPTYMTANPTQRPTTPPTTAIPTGHPTTPSPTHPGLVQCGVPIFGDFNEQELVFGISMPYKGDLTFVITGFNVVSIKAYSALDPGAILAISGIQQLTVPNVAQYTDIMFVVDGNGKGTFNAMLHCISPSPTESPTNRPTSNPIRPSPTRYPTMAPTLRPTSNPTTPSPTHPGLLQCGTTTSGDFNGGHINFNVIIPWEGDITFYVTGIDVMDIRAFGGHNPTEIISRTPIAGINSLTVFNLAANTEIIFVVDGVGKSTYNAMTYCNFQQPLPAIDNGVTTTRDPIISATANTVSVQTPAPTTPFPTTPAPTTPAPTTSAPTTLAPTAYPTTPHPTIPPQMQCGVALSGDFNEQQLVFNINMPFRGDLTFFISGFTVTTISAYNFLYPTTVLSQTPMIGINSLSVHNLKGNTDIVIKVDGIGRSTFYAVTECLPVVSAPITNTTLPNSGQPVQLKCDPSGDSLLNGEHNIHHILLNCCGATVSNLAASVRESGELTQAELDLFGYDRVYDIVLDQAIILVEKVNCDATKVDRDEIIQNSIIEIKELLIAENITKPPMDITSNEGQVESDKKNDSATVIVIILALVICCIGNITIMWCYFKRKQEVDRCRSNSVQN